MKIQGTQNLVLPFEQDDYKVYIRTNIQRIEEQGDEETTGFIGWEYDEISMSIAEYQSLLRNQQLKNQADIDYIAMMADVELGNEV